MAGHADSGTSSMNNDSQTCDLFDRQRIPAAPVEITDGALGKEQFT